MLVARLSSTGVESHHGPTDEDSRLGLTWWALCALIATLATAPPSDDDFSSHSPTHSEVVCPELNGGSGEIAGPAGLTLCLGGRTAQLTTADGPVLPTFAALARSFGASGSQGLLRRPRFPPPSERAPLYLLYASFLS